MHYTREERKGIYRATTDNIVYEITQEPNSCE